MRQTPGVTKCTIVRDVRRVVITRVVNKVICVELNCLKDCALPRGLRLEVGQAGPPNRIASKDR